MAVGVVVAKTGVGDLSMTTRLDPGVDRGVDTRREFSGLLEMEFVGVGTGFGSSVPYLPSNTKIDQLALSP